MYCRPKNISNRQENHVFLYQTRVEITQLILSILLFFAVFLGKGSCPDNLIRVYDRMLDVISHNTDFQALLIQFETSLSDALPPLDSLHLLEQNVPELQNKTPQTFASLQNIPIPKLKSGYFFKNQNQQGPIECYLDTQPKLVKKELSPSLQLTEKEEIASIPALGTILEYVETNQDLPEHCTMNRLSLGELEVITPVLGRLNSEFGYRIHPIDGKQQFHAGVDLGGQYGDPIGAFADGIVDYIGEDDSYGLYIQLDHGNGIKSFYAHCQSLQVKQGEVVQAGETIGSVGSSGSATGPHLHLEIKWNGTYLNPVYYIDVLEE